MSVSKRAPLGAPALIAIVMATAAQSQPIESRYSFLNGLTCDVVETGEALGQDWILHQCDGSGGVPVWLLYQDSARLQVAFGRRDFEDYRPWSADRDPAWPIEWRGRAGHTPAAAIMRFRLPSVDGGPNNVSELAVFRVWPDRADCFIGVVTDNVEARLLADQSMQLNACPGE